MAVSPGAVLYGWVALIRSRLLATLVPLLALLLALPAQADKLSLWRIRTSSATLYLLGSIHAVKADTYPLPAPMEAAFAQADTLVLEVDMSRLSPQEISRAIARRGHYPQGQTIRDALTPDTWRALSAWLDTRNIAYSGIAHTRPWLLAINIQMGALQRLGYDPAYGIDRHFYQEARRAGKRIEALETWQQQIGLLSDMPAKVQDVELRATLASLDHTRKDMATLVDAWRHGDVDRLYSLYMRDAHSDPQLDRWMTRLTVDRNERMAAKIRGYLSKGGHWLVVVGALHMGGPRGLVKLLGASYPIRQIGKASP